jgi:hypothetical protein
MHAQLQVQRVVLLRLGLQVVVVWCGLVLQLCLIPFS